MAQFPQKFTQEPRALGNDLDTKGKQALAGLHEKGYEVALGLSKYYAGALSIMSRQAHIMEYCPKDCSSLRFATQGATEKWLSQGRAVFLLLQKVEGGRALADYLLSGYAWTGLDRNEVMEDYPITSAYRLAERALGKKLAADFIQAVISGTHRCFSEGRGLGLETFQSNPAVFIYRKLGFVDLQINVNQRQWRPTLNPDIPGGQILDRRLYMGYPNFLLED